MTRALIEQQEGSDYHSLNFEDGLAAVSTSTCQWACGRPGDLCGVATAGAFANHPRYEGASAFPILMRRFDAR